MDSEEMVKIAKCASCGLWEECTMGYIGCVKARFGGVWVCGLCEEAIKDEQARLGVGVGLEDALRVHASFRETMNYSAEGSTTHVLAYSIIQLIKKIISSSTPPSSIFPSNP
ncbi:hypothetical protein TorRG33x02_075040 [Trema orientale]|uniref:DUF1677 family protein n=1 Tax=Trema orientale TaxID=63057 RepID=A0A2P5FG71_TREOI|nr:hypothetical protein TorRG33x02_075040 [Trema orientale]